MTLSLTATLRPTLSVVGAPILLPSLAGITAAVAAAEASATAALASQTAAAASATAADSSEADAETAETNAETAQAAAEAAAATLTASLAADVLVKTATAGFSAERVVTDTSEIAVDWATAGQAKFGIVAGSIGAAKFNSSALGARVGMINGTLVQSRTGNAETFTIKTSTGSTPSATDPVFFVFNDGTGSFSVATVNAALTLTISSGSTLGTTNSVAFRVWIGAANDAGTVRLFAVNCVSSQSVATIDDWVTYSSTAEGGAGAADSAQVLYSGTAFTTKYACLVGFGDWNSGKAANGTWDTAPTKTVLFGPGVPRPGQPVQTAGNSTGAVATGTTVIPYDDTIPTSSEGDEFLSQAIIPRGAPNLLVVEAALHLANSGAAQLAGALFQDAGAAAIATAWQTLDTADFVRRVAIDHTLLAGTVSSTTLKVRAGGTAGTTTVNGTAAARRFGGVANSFIKVTEIMG
jgi:hypothetical protein